MGTSPNQSFQVPVVDHVHGVSVVVRSVVVPVAASVTTMVVVVPDARLGTEMFRTAGVVCPWFVRRIVFAWPAGTVRKSDAVVRPTPASAGVPSWAPGFT